MWIQLRTNCQPTAVPSHFSNTCNVPCCSWCQLQPLTMSHLQEMKWAIVEHEQSTIRPEKTILQFTAAACQKRLTSVTEIVTGGLAMSRFFTPQKETRSYSALVLSPSAMYNSAHRALGGYKPPRDDRRIARIPKP